MLLFESSASDDIARDDGNNKLFATTDDETIISDTEFDTISTGPFENALVEAGAGHGFISIGYQAIATAICMDCNDVSFAGAGANFTSRRASNNTIEG